MESCALLNRELTTDSHKLRNRSVIIETSQCTQDFIDNDLQLPVAILGEGFSLYMVRSHTFPYTWTQ